MLELTNECKQIHFCSTDCECIIESLRRSNAGTMEPAIEQCVLCLLMAKDTIEIFGCHGKEMKIAEILVKHFHFLADEISGWMSRKICTECWLKIEAFDLLYQSVYFTHQQSEMKVENDIDDNSVPNPVLFLDAKSDADIEKMDCNYRPQQSEWKPQKTNPEEQPMVDDVNAFESTNADHLEMKIPQYFHMVCDLCEYRFDSWLDAKEHYLQQHNISRAYLKCCNKKYILRGRILHHVSWHIDPNAFTCKVCSRRFNEKRALTSHLLRHTDESNRKFVCEKCNKRFTRQHILNRHLIDVHPIGISNFICEFCQKSFKLDQTLKTHILRVHERVEERICDICARIFKSKEGFQDHMLSHRETKEPRVQCTQCGIWLKNKGSLNKHVKAHTEKPQTCEICHKVKSTRSALKNHMQIVHGEAIYECTICEKKFKRQLTLTEHIASHTGQNLYTCPYCPKMFKSNSNMHKHRKHSHREQWALDRQKKQLIYANQTTMKA